MKTLESILVATVCLVFGAFPAILPAQTAGDAFTADELDAGARLVVTSVSGPAKAVLNQKAAVTYTVENRGDATSDAYKVSLYLSSDTKISPLEDRLLGTVSFPTGLKPKAVRKTTSKMLIPINGLSGKYYFGARTGGYGRASEKQVEIIRFTENDNQTVTDHKIGLVWQKHDDGIEREWQAAAQYCADLALDDNADWRLPRIDELETIVDYTRYQPAIDPIFTGCHADYYWSGSTGAYSSNYAWLINFYNGSAYWNVKSLLYYVRCVRGGPW